MRWVRAAMVLAALAAGEWLAVKPGIPIWIVLALAMPIGYSGADVIARWRR